MKTIFKPFRADMIAGYRIIESYWITKSERQEIRGVKTVRYRGWWERLLHGGSSIELIPLHETVQVPDLETVIKLGSDMLLMHPVLAMKFAEAVAAR